jgi:hypothetical protein
VSSSKQSRRTVPVQLDIEDALKGRPTRAKKAPPAREFATQCVLADTLRRWINPGWVWTAFPAGELRTEATASRLKRMGLQPGFFDLLFISPTGEHHWIELKKGRAPLTVEQVAFELAMKLRAVPVAVCRDYKSAIEQLQEWGALPAKVHVQ